MCIGIPYIIVLLFIAFFRYYIFLFLFFFFFFYKLEVCGNPALSKSVSAIFAVAFAYFLSLGHILVILMFQTLHQQADYDLL